MLQVSRSGLGIQAQCVLGGGGQVGRLRVDPGRCSGLIRLVGRVVTRGGPRTCEVEPRIRCPDERAGLHR